MSESERQAVAARRRLMAGVSLLLLFCCVAGSLVYSQLRPLAPRQNQPRMLYAASRKPSASLEERRLERARFLRDKWRSWALEHQAEIKAMLKASPNDRAAMLAVWNKVPQGFNYSPDGIQHEDLFPGHNPFSEVGYAWYGGKWDITPEFLAKTEPRFRDNAKDAVKRVNARQEQNFASHRDLVLCQSAGFDEKLITLWVSGRITNWTESPREERLKGQVAGKHDPIDPPYDFLQ